MLDTEIQRRQKMTKQILIVQIVEYDPKHCLDTPQEIANYLKEKLGQMHTSIDKDGQCFQVVFSQVKEATQDE